MATRTASYWLRLIRYAMGPRWAERPQRIQDAAKELAESLADQGGGNPARELYLLGIVLDLPRPEDVAPEPRVFDA